MNDIDKKLLTTPSPNNEFKPFDLNDFDPFDIKKVILATDAIIDNNLIVGYDLSAGTIGILNTNKSNIDPESRRNYLAQIDAIFLSTFYDRDSTKRKECIKIRSYIREDSTYHIGVELLNQLKKEQNEIQQKR